MALRTSTGNMYRFVSHTIDFITGSCIHKCPYCYRKGYGGKVKKLDNRELYTNLGKHNTIFVGSGGDMFAKDIAEEEIIKTLDHLYADNQRKGNEANKYFFQTKDPERFLKFAEHPLIKDSILCTTIETNRYDSKFMGNTPRPEERAVAMEKIAALDITPYVTAEPIMDFDLVEMVSLIKRCRPKKVSIGMNSRREIKLPEPSPEKICDLIDELLTFTKVDIKRNLTYYILDTYQKKHPEKKLKQTRG